MCRCMTKADYFYNNFIGRTLLKLIQKTGSFKLAAWFLHTRFSKILISRYIRKNNINMKEFEGQTYKCFADFFARKKDNSYYISDADTLISPCDGRLTVYPVTDDLLISMKGSQYRLQDIIPKEEIAELFSGGLCLVFRLDASDYHHFCCFDDMMLCETHFIPGLLHSVQPIACQTTPVYRLNRRWWSLLETVNFGRVVQIEVGAMLVGGVRLYEKSERFNRGDEMGNFELSGSTIVLLLDASVRRKLHLYESFRATWNGTVECKITMGEGIGILKNEA